MVKKNFLKSSLIIAIAVAMMLPVIPTMSFAASKPSITYSAHMQTYGWDKTNQKPGDALADEAKTFAGVTGESKRMEALEVNMAPMTGVTLEYRAHVQGEGWMAWTKVDDRAGHTATVGTTGRSLRVEALQLSVKGLTNYSILYRAHVQGEGWMDWVDAADPTAFAGTTGSSLRMEAFEIVVLPKTEFYYLNNHNGTHTISYNGVLGDEEDCVYGDYTVAGDTMTRQCALCGYSNGEKVSLQEVLTDAQLDGQSKISLKSVELTAPLTIPEGITLEVEDTLNVGTQEVTVNGDLICKHISSLENVTFAKDATLTYKGKYDNQETESEFLAAALTEGKAVRVIMEKGSTAQTVDNAVLAADTEMTLDLNGTTLNGAASNYMIKSSGDLTINDANFVNTNTSGKGINVKAGSLTINGGSIDTADDAIAVRGADPGTLNTDLSKFPVTLKNVEIKTEGAGGSPLAIYGKNSKVTLENVKASTKEVAACVYVNGQTSGATFKATNSTFVSEKDIAAQLPGNGNYTFDGCTLTGLDGIEFVSGKLTLNNTNVTATRNPSPEYKLKLTEGNGTFTGETGKNGLNWSGSNKFGQGILLKINTEAKVKEKCELNITGSSKITSSYAPALLIAGNKEVDSNDVDPHYSRTALSGYTEATEKGGAVVWAHYQAAN